MYQKNNCYTKHICHRWPVAILVSLRACWLLKGRLAAFGHTPHNAPYLQPICILDKCTSIHFVRSIATCTQLHIKCEQFVKLITYWPVSGACFRCQFLVLETGAGNRRQSSGARNHDTLSQQQESNLWPFVSVSEFLLIDYHSDWEFLSLLTAKEIYCLLDQSQFSF